MRFTAFSTLGAGLIISLSNLNGVKAIEATALCEWFAKLLIRPLHSILVEIGSLIGSSFL
jgi:hypothetical protein